MRKDHLSPEALRLHADAIAGHSPEDRAVGTIDCVAVRIRGIFDENERRLVCLYDDPVKDDPRLPDNPAHATLVVAREVADDDVAEIRTRLALAFGSLRPFTAA